MIYNKFLIMTLFFIGLLPITNFSSQTQTYTLKKLTEDYITGALDTDNLLINLENHLSKENKIQIPLWKYSKITWVPAELSRVLKSIRETEYRKDNIYTDMKDKMQKMLNATLGLVGKQDFDQLIDETSKNIKDIIQKALMMRNKEIQEGNANPIKKPTSQGWINWARNESARLWRTGSEKFSQATSYIASYIPKSIKDTVNAWSLQKKVTVFTAIAGALALVGYNKDVLIQTIQDAYDKAPST